MHILITSIIDIQQTPYSRLHHFIEHFVEKGHKVTLISIRDFWKHKGNKQNQELVKKINIHYITSKKMSLLMQKGKAFFSIDKILKKIDIDNVDIHLAYNSLILANIVSKKLKKTNTIYDLADDLPDMIKTSPQIPRLMQPVAEKFAKHMLKKNLKNAKVVVITAKEFLKSMKIQNYNHIYMPNGVDTKRFTPLKKKHKGTVIGYLGALREWVDLRPMLLAVKNLKNYKMRVLIVGGEEDLTQYKEFVKKHNIENVKFTGNVPYREVPKYINKMDITTMPFKKNRVTNGTCPLKLLEYLSCEKPAICSKLNETKSMLGDKVLYAGSALEWEKQISTLYHDHILREMLGKQGRVFVQQNFNWEKLCRKMEDVLKEHSR